jgi:CCR4-NOT transcription complex subunit 7/8
MNPLLNELNLGNGGLNSAQPSFAFPKSFSNGQTKSNSSTTSNGCHILNPTEEPIIRDVWEDNLEEEFRTIMYLVEKYNVIGMDTEFPGIVIRVNESHFNSVNEIEYKTIKMNVDELKLIQVGISLASEDGYLPEGVSTWQFNFKFDVNKDDHAKDAIELLSNSGIKFDKHAVKGINPQIFAEYLISSGLVLNEDIKWISFHGGFDFAYLVKMLNGQNLPDNDINFYKLLSPYFPTFYDLKHITRDIDNLKGGGLSKLANDLSVKRIGPQHQAGSDALLTLSTYFKLKESYLKTVLEQKYSNILHGIGHDYDEPSDYVYQNYLTPEYYYMMYGGFGGMNNMNSMMNSNYYSQNDGMYNNMSNGHYNMNFNVVFNNYGGQMPYIDANQKQKKYDFMGKAKS